jgi:hypothetical protein
VSCIAAIQYALFKDPNHNVFGYTDAAKCTAAIRLPDNGKYSWVDKGWWAESWSNWSPGSPSADVSPGGEIAYNATGRVQLYGSTTAENARSALRDNGNHLFPFSNISSRQSQNYGILVEARVRLPDATPTGFVFVGMLRAHATDSTISGMERMLGFVNTAQASNWRAVSMRNFNPADGITPSDFRKDTSIGITGSVFCNMVLEVSGAGKSARWRASSGVWTNNKIPVITTATDADLPSRRGEGVMDFGVQIREWEDDAIPPAVPMTATFSRLNIWAWRPGFVATRPVYRYN